MLFYVKWLIFLGPHKNDQHLIPLYNITPTLNFKVTRKKENLRK